MPACKNETVFPDLAFFSQNFKINLALLTKICSYQLQSYQIILFHSCLTKALKVLNVILEFGFGIGCPSNYLEANLFQFSQGLYFEILKDYGLDSDESGLEIAIFLARNE